MARHFFIVMCLRRFEEMELQAEIAPGRYYPTRLAAVLEGAPEFFLPCFSTREAAEAWADGRYAVCEAAEKEAV